MSSFTKQETDYFIETERLLLDLLKRRAETCSTKYPLEQCEQAVIANVTIPVTMLVHSLAYSLKGRYDLLAYINDLANQVKLLDNEDDAVRQIMIDAVHGEKQ